MKLLSREGEIEITEETIKALQVKWKSKNIEQELQKTKYALNVLRIKSEKTKEDWDAFRELDKQREKLSGLKLDWMAT